MSAIEGSVTLEDVFAVASAKRVPLAPELAGYLTLEIADGADAGGGDVDPRTVFISEEGTVALVRPKSALASGDAETSVRHLLAKLLEASGSATPALGVAAKRRTPAGMPALVEELEAALIPVNRAAGRRALARLAREVKRVTLGVGRNASARPPAPSAEPGRGRFEEEPATTKRAALSESAAAPGVPKAAPPAPRPNAGLPPPPAAAPPGVAPPPRREPSGAAPLAASPAARRPGEKLLGDDEVESLIASFEVGSSSVKEMSRDLKAIAGLDPTPPPPDAKTLAELTKDVGKGLPRRLDPSAPQAEDSSVDDLLAASAPSEAPPPARAPSAAPRGTDGVDDLLGLSEEHDGNGVDDLLRDVAPPPAAPLAPPPSPLVPEAAVGATDAGAGAPPRPCARGGPPAAQPRPERTGPAPAPVTGRREAAARAAPTEKLRSRREREPRAPKTTLALLTVALLALLATAGAIWWKAPYVFTGRRKPAVPSTSASAAVSAAPPTTPKCKVSLVLTDAPPGAEVLLRVGQAPVDVERMPVKTRLEFVATAEGHAPRRAVVKSDATWDTGADGKPRIDVPIQLDPSKARPGSVDPWPVAEPGSEVGGTGAPGTVHVVSNVRGAEVWLLAGLGPEARIEQLRCEGDIDVLVAGQPANARKRLHIGERDVQAAKPDAQGNRVVTVSAAGAAGPTPTGGAK